MTPEVSLASIMLSSAAVLVGIPLWLYLYQYRRHDRLAILLLFPALALIPIYNLVYLAIAVLVLSRALRRHPTPLIGSTLSSQ